MKRLSLSTILAIPALLFGLVQPGLAQQQGTVASYVVSIGGINVANIDIRLATEGATYQVDLSADVTGLASVVAQGSGAVNSGGQLTSDGLQSDRFHLETRTSSERFALSTSYSGGTATGSSVTPELENNPDRVPVASSHRSGVNDPLAAFILRADTLDAAICNRTLRIYTGIERFDMSLTFADMQEATSTRTAYQGPVVLCAMRYNPISGHFRSSEITNYLANSDRMLTWFMPLRDTGLVIPYRVLMGTSFGDMSMVLVGLN